MPKPFIDKKNKQVFSLYKSSSRDRFGHEISQVDLVEKKKRESTIVEEHGDGSDLDDEYYDDDEEYYDDDDEYYDEEEYYEDEDEEEQQKSGSKDKNKDLEKDDLHLLGFRNDGYDYSKHMRPIGGGVFIPAIYDMNELKKHKGGILELVQPSEPTPHMFGLEEISKNYVKDEKELKGKVDDDIIEALADDDEGDFEELDDDFILQANGGTLDGLENEVKETQRRLKQMELLDEDDELYYEDDEQDGDGKKVKRPLDEIMDQQLNLALAEYDDDDIGELDKERAQGACSTDAYKDVFDEFMADYEANHRPLHEQIEILKSRDKNIPLTDAEKKIIIERNWDEVEEEEVSEEEEKEQWDCETILTTYSNIYNHPKLIKETAPIKLSKKTGMPLGVLNQKKIQVEEEEESEEERVNLGQSRKNESKEEKKARKKAIKEEKRENKMVKKELKQAFKSEEIKQMNVIRSQKLNKLVSIQY